MSVLVNRVTNPRGRPADTGVDADPLAARQALLDALAAYTDTPVQWSTTEPGDTGVVWVDPATGEAREWTEARERLENRATDPSAMNLSQWVGTRADLSLVSGWGQHASAVRATWIGGVSTFASSVSVGHLEPGTTYAVRVHLRTGVPLRGSLRWRPSGSTGQNVFATFDTDGGEEVFEGTFTVDDTPQNDPRLMVLATNHPDDAAAFDVTGVQINPGALSEYRDGDSPGWVWDGEPHRSTSHRPARPAGWWPIEDPDVVAAGQTYADAVTALAPVGWDGAGLWWSVEHDAVYVPAGFEVTPPFALSVTGTLAVRDVARGTTTHHRVFGASPIPPASQDRQVRVLVAEGDYDGDVWDGDTEDEDTARHTILYTWDGPPHDSTSTRATTRRDGVWVEPGFHNVPFAGINITGLDPSEPSVINLWRSVPGEPRSIVQGAREMRVTAAAFVEDWGAPLGRPVTYTLEVVSGSVEPELLTDTITIESDTAWLQDPLNPVTAVPVVGGNRIPGRRDSFLTGASFTELVRELPDELHYPIGATLGVSLGGQRRAPSRIPLTVLTQAAQEAARLRTLLETAHPIMLRTPPNVDQIPAVTYLRVEASEQPVTTFLGGEVTRWVMTADTVRGPSVSVLVPRWTYGDVQALYGTYGEVIDGRRYLAWVRDPEALGSLSARSTTMSAAGD